MPRTDGRIEKGQSIRTAISAKAWNRAQDAADVVLGVRPGVEAGDGIPIPRAANIALVRNDSGVQVPVCGVLSLSFEGSGGIVVNPTGGSLSGTNSAATLAKEFFRQPVLRGITPTSARVLEVAIALEPVAPNAIGRFAVGGCFPCKVKRADLTHTYARGRVGDVSQLITTSCGPVKLIWVEGSVGDDRWAVGVM